MLYLIQKSGFTISFKFIIKLLSISYQKDSTLSESQFIKLLFQTKQINKKEFSEEKTI